MAFKLGSTVRQKVQVLEGSVVERRFNDSEDQMEYLVVMTDAQGNETGSRWFLESQIEVIGEPQ